MSENTAPSNTVKRLEEEGEVGADYLEELLDIVDLGGDIDIDVDHGRASIAVVASEEGDAQELAVLVGREWRSTRSRSGAHSSGGADSHR